MASSFSHLCSHWQVVFFLEKAKKAAKVVERYFSRLFFEKMKPKVCAISVDFCFSPSWKYWNTSTFNWNVKGFESPRIIKFLLNSQSLTTECRRIPHIMPTERRAERTLQLFSLELQLASEFLESSTSPFIWFYFIFFLLFLLTSWQSESLWNC